MAAHVKMLVMSLEGLWQVMSLDQAMLMTSGKERGGDGSRRPPALEPLRNNVLRGGAVCRRAELLRRGCGQEGCAERHRLRYGILHYMNLKLCRCSTAPGCVRQQLGSSCKFRVFTSFS